MNEYLNIIYEYQKVVEKYQKIIEIYEQTRALNDSNTAISYQLLDKALSENEKLKYRKLSCCFCDKEFGTVGFLRRHLEFCTYHPLYKYKEWYFNTKGESDK